MDPSEERAEVIRQLEQAVAMLEKGMDPRLVPTGGAILAYAVRGARDAGGVAGIPRGLVRDGERVRASGSPSFGSDARGAEMIITAMRFDPSIRCAGAVRYSREAVSVLDDLLLECCSFDQKHKPPGISTMNWGIASCCRDGVPDVIWDTGLDKAEGMIRFFGERPADVASNIIICSNRLIHIEL